MRNKQWIKASTINHQNHNFRRMTKNDRQPRLPSQPLELFVICFWFMVKILNLYAILYMCSLVLLLYSIYPFPAIHSLHVTLIYQLLTIYPGAFTLGYLCYIFDPCFMPLWFFHFRFATHSLPHACYICTRLQFKTSSVNVYLDLYHNYISAIWCFQIRCSDPGWNLSLTNGEQSTLTTTSCCIQIFD